MSPSARAHVPPAPAPTAHVAYLINQYPKVSHTFIRREILALERHGFTVDRIAIRGWDGDVVDPDDIAELGRTRFVLKDGIVPLLSATVRAALSRPRLFLSALGTAYRMSRKSERSFPYHMVYLAEACVILEWLRESGARHLHAHFGTNPAEVAMLVRLLGGPPYSYTAHGPEENDRGGFLGIDSKVRHARFVAAISSHTRSQIMRRTAPADWDKIKVVRCGLDAGFRDLRADPAPDSQHFVCIARLDREKGHAVLIEARARLRERYPDCRLVLVGDGELRPDLEAQIRSLGLLQQVKVMGWLDGARVREQILTARALVLPSFQEGLPVSIMEAMALRRPVIATSIAGIPELVRPGENGWLVPAGSAEELAAAMDACLVASTEELRLMGDRARDRVLEHHDIEREATKLSALFTESIADEAQPCR